MSNSVAIAGGKGMGEVKGGKIVMDGAMTRGGEHTVQCTEYELCTWNLYNLVNKYHPSKFD